MDVANVHHHLAVLVPKTFHTPSTVSYWNEMAKERRGMYYDGQADRSDSDWLDGLQEPMRLDSQK